MLAVISDAAPYFTVGVLVGIAASFVVWVMFR